MGRGGGPEREQTSADLQLGLALELSSWETWSKLLKFSESTLLIYS